MVSNSKLNFDSNFHEISTFKVDVNCQSIFLTALYQLNTCYGIDTCMLMNYTLVNCQIFIISSPRKLPNSIQTILITMITKFIVDYLNMHFQNNHQILVTIDIQNDHQI